jgi:hypothetical protein
MHAPHPLTPSLAATTKEQDTAAQFVEAVVDLDRSRFDYLVSVSTSLSRRHLPNLARIGRCLDSDKQSRPSKPP